MTEKLPAEWPRKLLEQTGVSGYSIRPFMFWLGSGCVKKRRGCPMFVVAESLAAHRPRPAPLFRPSRIVLAGGSNCTEDRRQLFEILPWRVPHARLYSDARYAPVERGLWGYWA